MKKVLVTGAGGFIGSHLTEYLIERGYKVVPMLRYKSEKNYGWLKIAIEKGKLDRESILFGDVCDRGFVKEAISECEVIFNLAALIGIPYSYTAMESYINVNINGVFNILEEIKNTNKILVQTSTSETYGTAQYVPIDENHRKHAQSPYAATKIAADEIALSYYRSFGTRVRVIRPFNTYGPRQSFRAVIPTIIGQVLSNECSQISLGNTNATRDFNFVIDTVTAFEKISDNDFCDGLALNVASNFEISVQKVAQLIMDYLDIKKEIITDKNRLRPENSEVERLYGSNKKFLSLTGWKPKYLGIEGFEKGLIKTINWFKINKKLNKDYLV